jgi:hypothetical protein
LITNVGSEVAAVLPPVFVATTVTLKVIPPSVATMS